MTRRPLTLLLLVLCLAPPAAAHHVWLVPADALPAPGRAVPVELRIGHHDPGERLPRNPHRIRRFALLGPDGESPVPGVGGATPAGIAHPSGAGDQAVVYRGSEGRIVLPAAKFNRYLEEQGLTAVLRRRAARGETDRPGREVYSRSLKALLTVGGEGTGGDGPAAPSVHVAPTGLDLELVPETRPAELQRGDTLELRLLWHGAPRAGVQVTAAPIPHGAHPAADPPRTTVVSDADGRLRLALPTAGPWQLTAVVMEPADDRPDAEWRSVWTSLTFTVPLEAGTRIQ